MTTTPQFTPEIEQYARQLRAMNLRLVRSFGIRELPPVPEKACVAPLASAECAPCPTPSLRPASSARDR